MQSLQGSSNTSNESTSANRDDNCINFWHLFENLQAQSPLTRHNMRMVVSGKTIQIKGKYGQRFLNVDQKAHNLSNCFQLGEN